MVYKVGSIFAGVGGIDLGFLNASNGNDKFEVVWANEFDKFACETYRTNFDSTLLEGDIVKILHPDENDEEYQEMHNKILEQDIDILVGGFPCQPFSLAGEQKGFADERGNMFLNIIDLINQLGAKHRKPRVVFLENVKNLLNHDNGRTYKIIKGKLEECGYIVNEKVLNTMDYTDVPQNRERIFIVCFLNKEDNDRFNGFNEDFLKKKRKKHSAEEYARILDNIIDYDMKYEDGKEYYYTKEKYPHYFLTQEEYDALSDKKNERVNMAEKITEKYQFYQCRRGMYIRKNMSNVCPTLTANMGTGGHNVPLIKVDDGIRKITPSEAFKLQGFPIGNGYELPTTFNGRTYARSSLYKQAGNSVTVPIITFVANEILKALD